jgi:kanamycin kinase
VAVYVKWAPVRSGIDLSGEAARLRWAAPFARVPEVLSLDSDGDGMWLMTQGLPGSSAVAPAWIREPRRATRAIAEGLRALHDTLPVDGCPFSWSVADRIGRAGGPPAPSQWHAEHRGLSVAEARRLLDEPPPHDRLVVCHGDPCAPNTLMDDKGRWCGHVDFDQMGVADRWADLAVATWSLAWNYGDGFDAEFFAAYGISRDPERVRYYRLLWDYA